MSVMAPKRKNRKWKLISFLGILIIFFGLLMLRMMNPYSYILSSDAENQPDQISMYNIILSDTKFNELISDLLQSNDVRTINSVALYCKQNSLCNQVEALEFKAKELYEIPKDSTWITEINYSYQRESRREMLDLPNNLQYNLSILKEKCN